jgi:hypothetical protein
MFGESLIISGSTIFDDDENAIGSLMNEWTSDRSSAERLANLTGVGNGERNNGNVFLKLGETVFDDHDVDMIFSNAARDRNLGAAVNDRLLNLRR